MGILVKIMKLTFVHFKGSFSHNNHTGVNPFFRSIIFYLKFLPVFHKRQEQRCFKLMYQSSEPQHFSELSFLSLEMFPEEE